MYSVGMAEVTDVDQMKSNLSMVENSRRSIERNIEFTMNLLRFQLGLERDTELVLSTTLDQLLAETDIQEVLSLNLNYKTNIDYILLETQEKMSGLTLKNEKAAILPSISGFYSWNKNGMGNELNELQWFPNSMLGFQLNVPIFASGQRYARIRRAQFELDKAAMNKSQITDNLLLQEKQLRFNLASAKEQYESQLENVAVSKRVYESVNNKYREGMASSLDVTQAQNIMLTAESNYETAVLNLLQSKLALQKLLNNF
jgi:outer membrane protein TolC